MQSNRTEEIVVRLRQIQYWINWLSAGFATGKWDAIYLGRGFDFQGVAPFNDDPDLVRINWQATLISGELWVSQFSEERNVGVYFLGDLNPSMAFGSEISKFDRLAQLAAVVAFSVMRLKDNFNFLGYTDRVEAGFSRARDRTYPLALAQMILGFDWRGKKRGGLLKAALRIPTRRSLVIIASDFWGDLTETEQALRVLAPNHEVLPLIIWDEREVALPGKGFGIYPVRDLLTGGVSYVFLTEKTRRRFAENSQLRRKALSELFARFGIQPHFFVGGVADDDIEALMKIFLSQRNRV